MADQILYRQSVLSWMMAYLDKNEEEELYFQEQFPVAECINVKPNLRNIKL